MTCSACVSHVEKAVSKVPGVKACSVSLVTSSMNVEGTASDTADTTDTAGEVPEPPADAPQDDKDDLPF